MRAFALTVYILNIVTGLTFSFLAWKYDFGTRTVALFAWMRKTVVPKSKAWTKYVNGAEKFMDGNPELAKLNTKIEQGPLMKYLYIFIGVAISAVSTCLLFVEDNYDLTTILVFTFCFLALIAQATMLMKLGSPS